MLRYCPRLPETLARLRRLYESRDQGLILASLQAPSLALAEYAGQRTPGLCEYPDPSERAAFWDRYLAERVEILDDSVPSAYLSEFDQGLYGALLGGQPQFMFDAERGWVSSMVAPLLRDWGDFDRLGFSPDSAWAERYVHQLRVFRKAAGDKFGLSHFILIDGLNLVFELVGATETYLTIQDDPAQVERAVALGFDLNLWVHRTFFSEIPLLHGGTCSNFAQWLPGRVVSESVDPFHMTSVRYFEKWGAPNVERVLAQFDGGILHLHANGRHLLEAVCALPGVKALALLDDEGYMPAFDLVPEMKKRAGEMPLIVKAESPRFVQALEARQLPGGVFYKVQNVPDAAEANRVMDQVRRLGE